MTDKTHSSTDNTSISIISSNYEILELARLKAAESVVNIDQFYLEIKNEIDIYSDIESTPDDNNFETINKTTKAEPINNITEPKANENENSAELFSTELNPDISKSPLSLVPQLWTGKTLHTLPSMAQIVDTRASDRYTLGMIALKSGNWIDAISHFSRCIHLKPKEPSYYVNRAEIFIQLVDFQSAILNYKRACILDPANEGFLQRLAFLLVFQSQILFDQGLYSRALDSLGRAIEIAPTNPAYQMRAIAVLAAMHRHSECLVLVNKQIAIDNSNADLFVLRSKLHSHFRNFSLSYYDLVDALAADRNHKEAGKVLREMAQRADNLETQSTQLALANRLRDAASRISLAIELNPLVGEYHVKRGAFYRRLGDFTAAIDDFIMAMDKVDHDEQRDTYRHAERQLVLTFNDFAVQCFATGCYDDAVELLNKAIQREKSEPLFYINRGDCFFHLQQWDFALADYGQASALSGELDRVTVTRTALVHYSMGQQHFNNANYSEAERELTEAISINPFPAAFWNLRARTRYVVDNVPAARKDLICGILLEGPDKAMQSICGRLFPDKTGAEIVRSNLARSTKTELDRLVRQRAPLFDRTAADSYCGPPQHPPDKIASCAPQDHRIVSQYQRVDHEIRQCSDDRRFMKKPETHIVALPDLDVPSNGPANICRVGRRLTDGSKFFVDDQGSISLATEPRGWRTFKGGIAMK